MEDKTNIPLTASEMSGLWTQYVNDTVATCVGSYFLKTVEDKEVRPIVELTLNTAKEYISIMEGIFIKENFPIPIGFSELDVNLNAPKLFSDTYMLVYLRNMASLAMAASCAVIAVATRPDVLSFHKRILNAGLALNDQSKDLMLKQGTYVRPPVISTPYQVDFVEKQHFLAGFIGK
jgi:hypothetical protein